MISFSKKDVLLIESSGKLHDIGKVAIPSEIIEKKGKLTIEEYKIMREHVCHSYYILKNIKGFEKICNFAALHHERLDGNGYFFGLTRTEIPKGASIIMVSDIFTALSEDRPYRKAMNKNAVKKTMANLAKRGVIDGELLKIITNNGIFHDIVAEIKDKKANEKLFHDIFNKKIVYAA